MTFSIKDGGGGTVMGKLCVCVHIYICSLYGDNNVSFHHMFVVSGPQNANVM